MASSSLKNAIQRVVGESTDLLIGVVTNANPLDIKIQGDFSRIVGESLLIVPDHLKKRTIKMLIDDELKSVVVDESLKANDEVAILSIDRGSIYLVVGRC